jgi:hypothetical protein
MVWLALLVLALAPSGRARTASSASSARSSSTSDCNTKSDRPWASLCANRFRHIAWFHQGFWPHDSAIGYFRKRERSELASTARPSARRAGKFQTDEWRDKWQRESLLRTQMQREHRHCSRSLYSKIKIERLILVCAVLRQVY